MKFDFDKWFGVIDKDNRADDYYAKGEEYRYCNKCFNLMVTTGKKKYKCPVCGCTKGSKW